MKKEEFIEYYCARSKIDWAELSKRRVVLPCECGGEICKGWAMIPKQENEIEMIYETQNGTQKTEKIAG